MGTVIGIPTTRVSELFVRQRLSNQVQSDQLDLFRIQTQLSTGRRFQMPSEDADAAARGMSLQRLLERKGQVRNNLTTNQSFLSATDSALSTVSNNLAEVRGTALAMVGATANDTQRRSAAQQVLEMVRQLQDVGNQMFRGRYLFAGTGTTVVPFETTEAGFVDYAGNEGRLSSYADIDLLFDTNLHGNEVFGAISEKMRGQKDLDPILNYNTRLADLRGGLGITSGSIAISIDGQTSTVDISGSETIGDVALLIRDNPPDGHALDVEITPSGLRIEVAGDPNKLLLIREVGGGTTAEELGILNEGGPGGPVNGDDLNPILRLTTRMDDVLGVRARAVVRSVSADSDLIFEAGEVGDALDDIKIVFEDDPAVVIAGEDETASYDAGTKTLTVKIDAGRTEARHVVDAIETAYEAGDVPLLARIDPLDESNGGCGLVDETPAGESAGITDYGSGTALDKDSGIQIVNDEQTHLIDISSTETIEDLLNVLNMSAAGVAAAIGEDGAVIDLRSRISGTDFTVGENGGSTATQLGLRSFTENTRLDELNYGRGVDVGEGTDFTITVAATVDDPIDIDVSGLDTVGQVIALINAQDPGNLQARLALYGNGIELIDSSTGDNSLEVNRMGVSNAAIDLGLIPGAGDPGEASLHASNPPVGLTPATVSVASAGLHNDLIFTAKNDGTEYNGVTVVFDDALPPGADYDAELKTLTFGIVAGVTTAGDIINDLQISAAGDLFEAVLDPLDGAPNLGTGAVDAGASVPMNGGSSIHDGSDANPLETKGIFTALVRLQHALQNSDVPEIERAVGLLDQANVQLNFARAELGARQQGLDVMQIRLDTEEIELKRTLSLELDVDLVEAISAFTGKQIAFEASLRTAGQLLQYSLLNFL